MEALRTQVDNLQRDKEQVENRRLKEQDPEAGARVDGEAKLVIARSEIAELEERIGRFEQQIAVADRATTDAKNELTKPRSEKLPYVKI